ncbi:MAG: hypothetical protein DRQ88_02895 [Epsilonproteobacteria bacterium]|nr:MAG: hypothetical protein DRQ89_01850 [Campylobacterota bacterium]RLA67420.1 MAG: hypothetical protein DRQ88_02895 [Campylobacterota bacterium]
MQTTLSSFPHLFKETYTLIENSLNYPQSESFSVDFYPIMNPQNFNNNHILFNHETNEVMAHIGINFREIINGDHKLSVALIGGVAVKEAYRGQGLLNKLLNNLLKKYEQKVALFILWSDLIELYKKFGFYPAGCFLDSKSEGLVPTKFIKTKFNALDSHDLDRVKGIYSDVLCHKYFTFKRSNDDWEKIKKINSTDLYLSRDEKGEIENYFCMNKGGDLKGVVHEIGYLKNGHQKVLNDLKSLRLWTPTLGAVGDLKYLGLFKIGNINFLKEFLKIRSNGDLILTHYKKNKVSFNLKKIRYSVNTSDFLQYIFGPFPPDEFKDIACKLFFSGLDSI